MCKPTVTNTFTTDVTLSLPLSHSVARLVDCDCFPINRSISTYIDCVSFECQYE